MGFFDKLKNGLSKTRDNFSQKVNDVFKAFVKIDDDLFDELEEALITADVGVNTSMEIIEKLRDVAKEKRLQDGMELKEELKNIIFEMMDSGFKELKLDTKPSVILVIGVNGVGKTTSIGKIASLLKNDGKKVLLAAADTFRAAAIEQLEIWADRAGVDIVKHSEGSDPAAVVFDAIGAAKSRGVDVLICDTAGRLHNKVNLMNELNKIFRVIERELPGASKEVLLVLDATTGQNALSQAKLFGETAVISGVVLTKLDGTAKGGAVIAINNEQSIPVKLIGVGEGMDDLQYFNPRDFANALFDEDNGEEI